MIKKYKAQLLLSLVFIGFFVWWLSFQHVVKKQGVSVQWFGGTYGAMALIGSVIGFTASRKWGGHKSVLGKALIFFSLSLLAQEAGQLIYTYYIYGAHIQIPYPSWGDAAYFGSVILYIIAAILLTKAVGGGFSLRQAKNKALLVVVPLVLLISSYSVLLLHHKYDFSHPLTVFLDFGYPMGQAIYVSIAILAFLLSRKMLGGVMRKGVLMVIFALLIQYAADSNFVYQSSRGIYLSGQFADFLYFISYFVMALALINFHTIYRNITSRSTTVADDQPEPEQASAVEQESEEAVAAPEPKQDESSDTNDEGAGKV